MLEEVSRSRPDVNVLVARVLVVHVQQQFLGASPDTWHDKVEHPRVVGLKDVRAIHGGPIIDCRSVLVSCVAYGLHAEQEACSVEGFAAAPSFPRCFHRRSRSILRVRFFKFFGSEVEGGRSRRHGKYGGAC